MGLEAVIFDLDGTLVDSERLYHKAANIFLRKFNLSVSKEEYIQRWMVNSAGTEGLLRENNINYPEEKGRWKRRKIYIGLFNAEAELRPGAKRLVQELSKRVKLAIVSGGLGDDINHLLEKFSIDSYFSTIVSREDTFRSKPDPEPYKMALNELGVYPHQAVAIEDSTKGVISAKRAKMICVAVPNDYTKKMDFTIAEKVFTSLQQINYKKLLEVYSNGKNIW